MRYSHLLAALVVFAALNTVLLGVHLSSPRLIDSPSFSGTSAYTIAGSENSTSSSLSTYSIDGAVSAQQTKADFVASSAAALTRSKPLATGVQFLQANSLLLAPGSWLAAGGMWIWRGRMKSKWTRLGFDSDVFGLFVKMKGAKTRIRLLDALSVPKDRFQLAQELGLDWKGVDRHLEILGRYGFVSERVAYGKVRIYELTSIGRTLLQLLEELNRDVLGDQREPLATLSH